MKAKVQFSQPTRPVVARRPIVASSGGPKTQLSQGTIKGDPLPPFREEEGSPILPRTPTKKNEQELIQQAKDLVGLLDPAQKKRLLDELALEQLSTSATKTPDQARNLDMWATAVYEAFSAALGGSTATGIGPVLVRRTMAQQSVWAPVESFLEVSRLGELSVQERLGIFRMLAQMLVSHSRKVARYGKVPVSIKLVGNNTGNLAGLFEDAFPGYLAAGMARIVARMASAKSHV